MDTDVTLLNHPLRVLQFQTDMGVTGGIASYISELILSREMQAFSFFVVVAKLAGNEEAIKILYGDTSVIIEMPATYSPWSLLSYVRKLRALIRTHQIDVVHAHAVRSAFAAAIVSLFDGVPLVYTNHGLRYTQKSSAIGKLAFMLMEWFVCRIATKVCAIRRFDYDVLAGSSALGSCNLCLIETRINVPTMVNAHAAAVKFGLETGEVRPWLFVGIGSLIDVKRPDRFFNWVRGLQAHQLDFRAVWIGDGPMRPVLEQRAAALDVPITFLGQQSRETVFNILANAHLLFLTSQFEVFPFAVLEAYSQGVPVISSRFPGAEDFIHSNKTGLLVDADNTEEVAVRIATLLGDATQREAMRQAALSEFARRFGEPELMSQAYSKTYLDSVVDANGQP
jgi:glycosyltransferase involved in cell wall biosynthesis